MRYRHTMVRVRNLEESLDFYCNKLGLIETRRVERPQQKYTLVFLAAPQDVERAKADRSCELELTYNYDPEDYGSARNFGHLAYEVDNIYEVCQRLLDKGVTINRPPRDGNLAFVRSPDLISIEIIQKGPALEPKEPWKSMPNVGTW
ncbi:MAG TPA: VOC family protein [Hyphomicrobiaceae bacterium]|nr:VOC family protein [Hyphomicrobiaceae bacterium]